MKIVVAFLILTGSPSFAQGSNLSKLVELLDRTCEMGHIENCEKLAIAYSVDRESRFLACSLGVTSLCRADPGLIDDIPKNISLATQNYAKVCNAGRTDACFWQAENLSSIGHISQAKAIYASICRPGFAAPCLQLGLLLKNEGNSVEAMDAFDYGCDYGLPNSCAHLEQMSQENGLTWRAESAAKRGCALHEVYCRN